MSNRQLEQLRETLDSIVEDLCNREQAVDKEQAHLLERLNELDQRQSDLKALDDIVAQHQASEQALSDKLQALVQSLDERSAARPQWIDDALEKLESRVIEKIIAAQSTQPALADVVREVERVQSRSVQSLVEQLTISLQTAIAVQLAPLTDELPERLTNALANTSPASPLSTPELARELEKFESRSMASLAARMTAGLQTALASQWNSLTDGLPEKLATILAQSQPAALAVPIAAPAVEHNSHDSAKIEQEYRDRIDALTSDLDKTKSSLAETEALLSEALEHPPTVLASDVQRPNEDELIETLRVEIADLRKLLAAKEYDSHLVEELRNEVDRLRGAGEQAEGVLIHRDDELRERLEMATCEIIDLRSQNEELNERVSRSADQHSRSRTHAAPWPGRHELGRTQEVVAGPIGCGTRWYRA